MPIVFPVHPRTRQRLIDNKLWEPLESQRGIRLLEPAGYVDFMSLVFNAGYVLTDSGGLQEETTYLGIPCLTLRESTERPVTISQGTNRLVSADSLHYSLDEVFGGRWPKGRIPNLWDGHTAGRVAASLKLAAINA